MTTDKQVEAMLHSFAEDASANPESSCPMPAEQLRRGHKALKAALDAEPPLIGFLVTGFTGHYPVGTAAVVYARNREHCKRVLLQELQSVESPLRRLQQDSDYWTISPITPVPEHAGAVIVLDGNY
jgi:hypothetical protein